MLHRVTGVRRLFPFGCASSTHLAGIQRLAPEDTLCGNLEVRRVWIDDHGRLPA